MDIAALIHPLLSNMRIPAGPALNEQLLTELRDLAALHDDCSTRSRVLYERLRKMLGQDRLKACLLGIQALAVNGEPAGARLLAALLDANTPGSALLPRICRFRSIGRMLATDSELVGTSFMAAWQGRLADILVACSQRFGLLSADDPNRSTAITERPPLPSLRRALEILTAGAENTPDDPSCRSMPAADQRLLAGLVRLECEAYQERVSRLAGSIDPYRAAAVMRVLPLLSRADAEIRDLDLLASWLENGEFAQAFERRIPTGWDVLEESERLRLANALNSEARLSPLAAVHETFSNAPLSVRQVAGPAARLLVLGRALVRSGLRKEPMHLLDAVHLVLRHTRGGDFELALTRDLKSAVAGCLAHAGSDTGNTLSDLRIRGDVLVLQQPDRTSVDRFWRHDLPTLQEAESGAPAAPVSDEAHVDRAPKEALRGSGKDRARDTSSQAVKQLVMNSVGCVSIVLGFLRNPRVTSIPGLVADVVRRTRSSRVLEVIAGDRSLTSGHANKDVPRALLESPVNVSVKTLRRFIHVKYVSKTDLRRLAKDKARLRKEVCVEIEKYLASLV